MVPIQNNVKVCHNEAKTYHNEVFKGLVRLKPRPIGETLSHQQPLVYTVTLLRESDDSSATTMLRQAKLSLEPMAPILFSMVWILLKCVPTAGLYPTSGRAVLLSKHSKIHFW